MSEMQEYVKAALAIGVIFGYLSWLSLCLWNLQIPQYATTFDTLLKWSFVPGLVLGAYFGSSSVASIRRMLCWLLNDGADA